MLGCAGARHVTSINFVKISRVNPVTGCIEPPHANPLEGMTEEQKEYEAVKLANLMSKLSE